MDALLNLDGNILIMIQEYLRNSILTPFFLFMTKLGDSGIIWVIISIILICIRKTRKIGIVCLCSLAFSYLINNMAIKSIVNRTRPFDAIEGLSVLINKPLDASFPSGHAASSFACAAVLFKRLPNKFGIPAIMLALLIGFSRLYIGVHYPSDVLFGIISGTFVGLVTDFVIEKITAKHGNADK